MAAVIVFVVAVVVMALVSMRKADSAAEDSAQAALTSEICEQLAAVPSDGRYPESLSQLRLTYPDGGDASLLRRFTYESTGTNCTLRIRLGDKEVLRSFP